MPHTTEISAHDNTSDNALLISAMGVVFGDIGTSPIYAVRESMAGQTAGALQIDYLMGILSLIFWSLMMVVSVKYLLFVVRAKNQGEGGIMALVALISGKKLTAKRADARLGIILGLFGACLLYGDGTITPAISVLSAVEGLHVALPQLSHWVVPTTVAILVALFAMQKMGSGTIGKWFGFIMLLWFSVLALLGLLNIVKAPGVLQALNPLLALQFFSANGVSGFLALGTVFLVITGGEALYADLGHFGARPIQRAWIILVFPALILNYLGQGALLISDPTSITAPFFHLAPNWASIPLVLLATVATVIASQAVISGTFSLTRQAIQLGHLPRMRIVFTDVDEEGQIYIPVINWLLMFASVGLVLGFQSSDALASAYGVAVSMDMLVTTLLATWVAWHYRWNKALALLFVAVFVVIDGAFLGANLVKVPSGGWYALVLALGVFLIMLSWRGGRKLLAKRLSAQAQSRQAFLAEIAEKPPIALPGTVVVMTSEQGDTIPASLMHHLKCTGALHERVILLTVNILHQPHVPAAERYAIESLGQGHWRMHVYFGFAQASNIPLALKLAQHGGFDIEPDEISYILSHETLVAKRDREGLPYWQELLFVFFSRNAARATAFFHLPEKQVLEIGIQVGL